MKLEEKTLEENIIFEGKIITVKRDIVELPDGNTSFREIIEHNGGVCVAVTDEDDNIYMVRQFRYPYKEIVTELPAGKLEKGEAPYDAGMREVREETGLIPDKLISLGKLYPSPGYCGETIYLYYAEGFEKSEQCLDSDEFLNVIKVPFGEALDMVMKGEIPDSKSQTVILKLALMRKGYK